MPDVVGSPGARCAHLVRIYRSATGETHALRGVDVELPRGVVTAVTGPSGSGKSSLLQVLALRERQDGGELWVDGHDVSRMAGGALRSLRRNGVGYLAQRPTHSLFEHLRAAEQLEQVAVVRGSERAQVDGLLDRLGLGDRRASFPRQLSGGEQQRLGVGAAVVGRPALVVADEPTAELDDASSELVLTELRRCAAEGSAVVFSTHDHRAVAAADRVLHLRHGVLSTESQAGGPATASIDSTGRLQLPPDALELFPDGRARVVVEDDGVRLLPPDPSTLRPHPGRPRG